MAFNWKGLIGAVAPTIATALGGPLAGAATSAISQAVFGKPDASEDELNKALSNATPETIAAIKKANNDFQVRMKEMDIDLEKINAGDRDSARNRAIAQNDKSPIYIGAIILCIWGFINIFLLMTSKPPVIGDMVLGRILGMIDAATLAFLYYIYGTSQGSSKKNDTINNLLK